LNIFIVDYTCAKYRQLYNNSAVKMLVVATMACAFATTLTLITFPSSTGIMQNLFAQITPVSLGNVNGNTTIDTNSNNINQPSTLLSNTTNSSSIVQLASYQPITPSSNRGPSQNGGETSSNDNEYEGEDEDQDVSDSEDDDHSYYDDDNGIVITSTDNYDNEEDNDDYSDDEDSYDSENDYSYDDNEDSSSSISISSSRGAFASAGGGGAFASAGGGGAFASVG
jgi:hypothetical protein